jgi:molybdenum cofactor synthesis domain-containing protein
MYDHNLLEKTELTLRNVVLQNANLTDIAGCVADILGLHRSEVMVVDYRDQDMTLDILNGLVNADGIVGKKGQLLAALNGLPGVTVSEDTSIHSDGMLGWIAMDAGPAREALGRSEQMARKIRENIAKRVIVFSTGAEVAEGRIEDTNGPAIQEALTPEGCRVSHGKTLKDDRSFIAAKLREAVDESGYGLIVTTGGVGAEDKDHTVEAVLTLDPGAAAPDICRFEIGTGRHVKAGVRIAVGEYHGTRIISLPGPNDEVKASLPVLVEGLRREQDKYALAENIAQCLRRILQEKTGRHAAQHHGQRHP